PGRRAVRPPGQPGVHRRCAADRAVRGPAPAGRVRAHRLAPDRDAERRVPRHAAPRLSLSAARSRAGARRTVPATPGTARPPLSAKPRAAVPATTRAPTARRRPARRAPAPAAPPRASAGRGAGRPTAAACRCPPAGRRPWPKCDGPACRARPPGARAPGPARWRWPPAPPHPRPAAPARACSAPAAAGRDTGAVPARRRQAPARSTRYAATCPSHHSGTGSAGPATGRTPGAGTGPRPRRAGNGTRRPAPAGRIWTCALGHASTCAAVSQKPGGVAAPPPPYGRRWRGPSCRLVTSPWRALAHNSHKIWLTMMLQPHYLVGVGSGSQGCRIKREVRWAARRIRHCPAAVTGNEPANTHWAQAWEAAEVGEGKPPVRKSEDLPTAARSTPRGAGRRSPEGDGWRSIGRRSRAASRPLRRCLRILRCAPDPRPPREGPGVHHATRGCAMTSQDTSSPVIPAASAMAAPRTTDAIAGDDHVPLPPAAAGSAPAPSAEATTWITKEAGNRRLAFDPARLERSIDAVAAEFPQLDIGDYKRAVLGFVARKPALSADDLVDHLIREAEARVDLTAPEWERFAARLYLRRLYKRASRNRFYDAGQKYGSYVGLQESLADRGIYSNDILRAYSKEELQEAGRMIEPERDRLFAYNGLYLLATRYLATDAAHNVYELPQERWLTIALYLMQDEK